MLAANIDYLELGSWSSVLWLLATTHCMHTFPHSHQIWVIQLKILILPKFSSERATLDHVVIVEMLFSALLYFY